MWKSDKIVQCSWGSVGRMRRFVAHRRLRSVGRYRVPLHFHLGQTCGAHASHVLRRARSHQFVTHRIFWIFHSNEKFMKDPWISAWNNTFPKIVTTTLNLNNNDKKNLAAFFGRGWEPPNFKVQACLSIRYRYFWQSFLSETPNLWRYRFKKYFRLVQTRLRIFCLYFFKSSGHIFRGISYFASFCIQKFFVEYF